MKLEELQREAKQDLNITDQERLDQESYKNQNIKAKWLDIEPSMINYSSLQTDHQKMYREKWEYYGGKVDAKVYVQPKPFDLKVLKTDLQMYINSDEEILNIQGKISYYETIIKYIDGVIKSIDNRGWDIRNATEWKKFEVGMV